MKKLMIMFIAGCILIGIGTAVTVFEAMTYEIMEEPIGYNNKEEFTIDLRESADLQINWYTDYEIKYDDNLENQAKIEVRYNGNDGDMKLKQESNHPPVYYLYDRQTDRRNIVRDFMLDLKDRKVNMSKYDERKEITVYVNEKDESKLEIF